MDSDTRLAVEKFLYDLTDPEGYGFSVTSEVRREALYLQTLLAKPKRLVVIDDE